MRTNAIQRKPLAAARDPRDGRAYPDANGTYYPCYRDPWQYARRGFGVTEFVIVHRIIDYLNGTHESFAPYDPAAWAEEDNISVREIEDSIARMTGYGALEWQYPDKRNRRGGLRPVFANWHKIPPRQRKACRVAVIRSSAQLCAREIEPLAQPDAVNTHSYALGADAIKECKEKNFERPMPDPETTNEPQPAAPEPDAYLARIPEKAAASVLAVAAIFAERHAAQWRAAGKGTLHPVQGIRVAHLLFEQSGREYLNYCESQWRRGEGIARANSPAMSEALARDFVARRWPHTHAAHVAEPVPDRSAALELGERYEAYITERTNRRIAEMKPGEYDQVLHAEMRRIRNEHTQYRWPEAALRERAVRQVRESLAAELELLTPEAFAAKTAG